MISAIVGAVVIIQAGALTSVPGDASAAASPVLVSTEWLASQLGNPELVILHVGNQNSFTQGHIPGARLLTVQQFAPDRNGLATELPEADAFRDLLRSLGVSNGSRIVVYGSAHPPTLAARLYVTLHHFGLGDRTSLLDGGWRAWSAEQRPVSTTAPDVSAGDVVLVPRADIIADIPEVQRRTVVDARDTRFFTGEQRNTQRAVRAGRVADAYNVVFSTLVSDSGHLLGREELATRFGGAGVPLGSPIAVYCHVGQQASLAFVAAKLLGYDVRLYDGSYEEWSGRPELPVQTGIRRE